MHEVIFLKKGLILIIFLSLFLSACGVKQAPQLVVEESNYTIGVGEEITITALTTNYEGGFSITFSEANIVSVNNLTLKGLKEGTVLVILSLTEAPSIKAYLFITVVNSDIPYSINYCLNGGEISINSPITYKTSQTPFILPIPIKSDHTFSGWYTTSDFSSASLHSLEKNTKGNLTLYAKWSK